MRAIIFSFLLLATSPAWATEFYVAPSGDDKNRGTQQQPFATLTGARDAVRAMRANSPLTEPVRVHVAGGEYRLTEPLVLTPEDSGTVSAPISYQAVEGSRPVFSGGRKITGWQRAEGGLWVG